MGERFVVLPRGINVGKANRIKMAELRDALLARGALDAATLLQSGNIAFELGGSAGSGSGSGPRSGAGVDDAAALVASVLGEEFAIDVACLARTRADIEAIIGANPLAAVATDPSRYVVTFLSAAPPAVAVAELLDEDHGSEQIAFVGTEAYVWAPDGLQKLSLSYRTLEKRFAVTATARNWNTVVKLATL